MGWKEDKSNTPEWVRKIKAFWADNKTFILLVVAVLTILSLLSGLLVELGFWGIALIILLFVFL